LHGVFLFWGKDGGRVRGSRARQAALWLCRVLVPAAFVYGTGKAGVSSLVP